MSKNNIFYVYEHWRLDRDECFYVGKGHGNRAYKLAGRNLHHRGIVAKLRRIGSAVEIKIVAAGLSEEEAFNLEKTRIQFWRDIVDLVNITDGGEGVSGPKISASRKGKKHSLESIAKMSAAKKGKARDQKTKEKLSIALKGNKNALGTEPSQETRTKLAIAATGKKQSEETKAKRAEKLKGRIVSEATRVKQSLSLKGRRLSEETRAKISKSLRMRANLQREAAQVKPEA